MEIRNPERGRKLSFAISPSKELLFIWRLETPKGDGNMNGAAREEFCGEYLEIRNPERGRKRRNNVMQKIQSIFGD